MWKRLRPYLWLALLLLVVFLIIWSVQTRQSPAQREATATPATQQVTPQPTNTQPAASPVTTTAAATSAAEPRGAPKRLRAYFLDVGQGDSILLLGPDFTILIDAGRHDRKDVVPYLEEIGVQSIDLLIGTHPHADHIGQFPEVLKRFPVKEVWMSGDTNTTRTFEDAIDAIADSGAAYHEPRAGEKYDIGSAHILVLNPDELTGEFNEGSVSIRIVFGDIAFIFTGDAEEPTEEAILAHGYDLSAQILKLGHHGSDTSSSAPFLQAVHPQVAIWSAATDNTYGHPSPVVLERLEQMGVATYGTAISSTITIVTDGKSFQVGDSTLIDLAPPPTPTPSVTPAAITTVNQNAIVRAGPGATFDVVDNLDAGTPVTPIARNQRGTWIYIQMAEGEQGWIEISLLEGIDAATLPVRAANQQPVATAAPACANGQVDINSASLEQLQEITQIGPARARQIIRLRPFTSIEDMVRIDGISESAVAIIKAQGIACVELE
jgi:competence protein ComEC